MESPPYDYLEIVLKSCPEAGSLYLILWNKRNKDDFVRFLRTHIEELFLMTPEQFKTRLFMLAQLALININEGLREHQEHYEIEVIGYEDECSGMGKVLC